VSGQQVLMTAVQIVSSDFAIRLFGEWNFSLSQRMARLRMKNPRPPERPGVGE
jgi:hypothetical protein